MLYGLEARAPWLDYRIVELAFRLPTSFNLRGRTGKFILREAVAPYVPEPLLKRKKMGFSVPLAEWFRTSLKPVFETLALGSGMEKFASVAEIRRIWAEHQSGLHNHDRKLWNLLMLASWDMKHTLPDSSSGSDASEAYALQ